MPCGRRPPGVRRSLPSRSASERFWLSLTLPSTSVTTISRPTIALRRPATNLSGASLTCQGSSRRPLVMVGESGDCLEHPGRVVDDPHGPGQVDGRVVPGRHHPTMRSLGGVVARRDVGVRPTDDNEGRRFVGDPLPVGVRPGQVGDEAVALPEDGQQGCVGPTVRTHRDDLTHVVGPDERLGLGAVGHGVELRHVHEVSLGRGRVERVERSGSRVGREEEPEIAASSTRWTPPWSRVARRHDQIKDRSRRRQSARGAPSGIATAEPNGPSSQIDTTAMAGMVGRCWP